MRTLAALAALPGRDVTRTLYSLRHQVTRLCVWWNGAADAIPPAVRRLADEVRVDPTNRWGASRKFGWAGTWDGLYLACDDDLAYPPDYVATMRGAVARWEGRAICTAHGRRLPPHATRWDEADLVGRALEDVAEGAWVNYPGACALAFDASRVPVGEVAWTGDGCTEQADLANWCQQTGTPIWLVPHRRGWLLNTLPRGAPTIWRRSVAEGHATENARLAAGAPWTLATL